MDPARAADVYGITAIQQIFDGLVQFDENLNVIPAIADSWRVSRDGHTYRFALKDDVRFHNGREVEAEDFVYSFTRVLNPEIRSNAARLFSRILGAGAVLEGKTSSVEGLRAVGARELEIRLREPYPPFLTILAMKSANVVPPEEVERKGSSFGRNPVGTGPFRFDQWKPTSEIVVRANQDYFEGGPSLEGITYVTYPGQEGDRMMKDFLAGRLESLRVNTASDRSLLSEKGYQILKKPTLGLLYYGINCARKPLENPKVRRALNLAIKKDAMISLLKKHVIARGVIPPGMPGYNPDQRGYPYDPERARTLLSDVGYPGGKASPSSISGPIRAQSLHRRKSAS
ncbi:MAG: hypothetical protein GTN81_04665 [Proteobacteria bacterium]|nr:hypothetical protein [Pseudomonadota bacterium]